MTGLLGPSAVAPRADEATLSRAKALDWPGGKAFKKIGKAFLTVSGVLLVVVMAVMITSLTPGSTSPNKKGR